MKLIDADKLLEWLSTREGEAYDNAAKTYSPSFFKGKAEAFKDVLDYVNVGHFDPTPPVQPDTPKSGDKVRHKDKQYAPNGIGIVREISKSGKQAYVEWTNWDKDHFKWGGPWPAYYRLDKLEVITDDTTP